LAANSVEMLAVSTADSKVAPKVASRAVQSAVALAASMAGYSVALRAAL